MNKMLKKSVMLALLVIISVGCSSMMSADAGDRYRDIVYSANLEPSTSGSSYVVKGYYTDESGGLVAIEEDLPWTLKLRNVSPNVKAKFEGHIFCIDTKKIIGEAFMLITVAGSDNVIYETKKEYDLYKESGYTSEQLKEATLFSFIEK